MFRENPLELGRDARLLLRGMRAVDDQLGIGAGNVGAAVGDDAVGDPGIAAEE